MAYPGGGGWWGGPGGYSRPGGGSYTYPTPSSKPAAPPPTTPKTTVINPPTHPPSPPPSTPTPPPNQPVVPAGPNTAPNINTNPSTNNPGQNNDGGNSNGSGSSGSILSRILSSNPAITQSATKTTLTLDSSLVAVVGVYTGSSVDIVYQVGSTQTNAQAGPSETPGTPAAASERSSVHPGTIAGALISGIVAALFASWAVWWFWKRNRRARSSEVFAFTANQPEFGSHTAYTSPLSEPSFGTRTPRTPPSPDDIPPSPAYSDITNDFLIPQPTGSSPSNDKSRVHDTPIVVEQPHRPALPILVIPRNDTINHTRTPSRSSLTTYRTGPPQYATIFNDQPTPNFRLSQMVSPLYTPQDTEPATLSAWTKWPQPYDVERGDSVGPSRF